MKCSTINRNSARPIPNWRWARLLLAYQSTQLDKFQGVWRIEGEAGKKFLLFPDLSPFISTVLVDPADKSMEHDGGLLFPTIHMRGSLVRTNCYASLTIKNTILLNQSILSPSVSSSFFLVAFDTGILLMNRFRANLLIESCSSFKCFCGMLRDM